MTRADETSETRLLRAQGVTAPAGFRAAGIAAGLKTSGARDLALVFNEGPDYAAAGVFTRNNVKAAPVLWTQQVLTTGQLRAVILNSGGANACTGPAGFQDTHATAEAVAAALSDWGTETGAVEVAVCSTGLIGDRLPMDKVLAGVTEIVHEMAGGLNGGEDAAHAIMTTAAVLPMTRCCCWHRAPAGSPRRRPISTTRCYGFARTCARSCKQTPRASPNASS
jgi:glutamate N-acetyltransferase/amino-acid N-acetyltransferase